jgi:hypothetical protein
MRDGVAQPRVSEGVGTGGEKTIRLAHHSMILELNVPSYRPEQARKKQQEQAAADSITWASEAEFPAPHLATPTRLATGICRPTCPSVDSHRSRPPAHWGWTNASSKSSEFSASRFAKKRGF